MGNDNCYIIVYSVTMLLIDWLICNCDSHLTFTINLNLNLSPINNLHLHLHLIPRISFSPELNHYLTLTPSH